MFGVIVILFWIFCAIFPGLVAPYNPIFDNQLPTSQPPSWDYYFGTDTNGRDVFSRVLAGSRNILLIAPAATLLGTVLGTIIGLITGYYRGVVDDVTSRLVDAVLSLPLIVTAILIVTAVGNSSRWVVVVIIGLIFAPVVSRTVRAAVLVGDRARLRPGGTPARRAVALHHVLRDPPERPLAGGRRVHRAARVRDLRRRLPRRSSASASSRPRPTGQRRSTSTGRSSTRTGG